MKRTFVASIALLIALTTGGALAQGASKNILQEAPAPTPLPTAMPSPIATRSAIIPNFTPVSSTTRRHQGRRKKAQTTATPTPVPVQPGSSQNQPGTSNPKK